MMYFNSPYSFMQSSMYNQGVMQGFNTGYSYSQSSGDFKNIGFTAIIRVKPNVCACDTSCMHTSIYVRNTGMPSTIINSAITITKIA